ncbi:MAG: twin-arginine translocase TatA/TatE family subunit [Terracidiphilus sp.]|jgi:sec-independent protein translocase protein TatB
MVLTPTIQFASLGMADSLILMVLALVVFGPRRLPQIGRQIGKLMYEFRKASNDFKFQMEEELRNAEEADRRKAEEERLRALALAAPAQTAQTIEADAATTVESPYPNEISYPPVATATPEAPAVDTYPHIQPPSTGEPVPAARPAIAAAQAEAAEEPNPAASPDANAEAITGSGAVPDHAHAEEPAPAMEPVNHHG